MSSGRRKPKLKLPLRAYMDLPREVCPACAAEFLIHDCATFPEHNFGDGPDWWGEGRCRMSGKPIRRRQAKKKNPMVAKYAAKRKQYGS